MYLYRTQSRRFFPSNSCPIRGVVPSRTTCRHPPDARRSRTSTTSSVGVGTLDEVIVVRTPPGSRVGLRRHDVRRRPRGALEDPASTRTPPRLVVDLGSPPPESAPSVPDRLSARRVRGRARPARSHARRRAPADLAAVASAENDVFRRGGDVTTDAVTLEATRTRSTSARPRRRGGSRRGGGTRRAETGASPRTRGARAPPRRRRVPNRAPAPAVTPCFSTRRAPRSRAARAATADARDGHARGGRRGGREPFARSRNPAHEPRDATAGRVSGGANKNAFWQTARRSWYCDALEARLLRTFEDAERGGDDAAAMDAAAALRRSARRLAGAVRRDQADVHARREFRAGQFNRRAGREDPSSGARKTLFQVRRRPPARRARARRRRERASRRVRVHQGRHRRRDARARAVPGRTRVRAGRRGADAPRRRAERRRRAMDASWRRAGADACV